MAGIGSGIRTSRRKILDFLLKLGIFGWLASVLYPVISYLKPLPQSGSTGPVQLTRSEETKLEANKFTIVPAGLKRLIVFEDPTGKGRALDAKCTHEGCIVQYVPREAIVWCACHNGRYDLNGRVISGPPPRPLPSFEVERDKDGNILVAPEPAT